MISISRNTYPIHQLFRSICILSFMTLLLSSVSLANAASFKSDKKTDEYEALGLAFSEALGNQDTDKVMALFDSEHFATTVADQVFANYIDKRSFINGFKESSRTNFIERIFSGIYMQEGSVLYLKVISTPSGKRPTIRIDMQEGGHDYLQLVPEKIDGKLKVVDFFTATSGKNSSTAFVEAVSLMTAKNDSLISKMLGLKKADEEIIQLFTKVGELKKQGKFKEAYDLLNGIPESKTRSRVMLDSLIQLSQYVSDEEYLKQLKRLAKHHGDDTSTTFMLIDYYFMINDIPKVQIAIDRLIDFYGKDAALLNLKASTSFSTGDLKNAAIYAKEATELEPNFETAHWTLVTVLASQNRFTDLIAELESITELFGYVYEQENFEGEAVYAEFIKSKEFKAWINKQN